MRSRLGILLVALALVATGCGGNDEDGGAATRTATVTVFAAASLTESFNSMKADFTSANPGVDVRFNFAGSQALAGQIQQGAPADVFASADQANMRKVTDAGLADGRPGLFARNLLEIVVAKGNPKAVKDLADLARADLKVVLAAEEVPAGRYTRQALDAQLVKARPVSLEDNVKAVVTKVALGEADAGVVYATDVQAAGERVAGVEIPAAANIPAEYPIAVLSDARSKAAAKAFVDFVLSEAGQSKLESFGFLPGAAA